MKYKPLYQEGDEVVYSSSVHCIVEKVGYSDMLDKTPYYIRVLGGKGAAWVRSDCITPL